VTLNLTMALLLIFVTDVLVMTKNELGMYVSSVREKLSEQLEKHVSRGNILQSSVFRTQ
jgi:hypothetical protein